MTTNEILLDHKKSPEERVYLIAKEIRSSGRSIDDDLWYAILDMKDKNFPMIDMTNNDYFNTQEKT